ncbi:MAG: VWA domain-containing protein [Chloroflexota bacterium]|nr:VWA domain-containing protein [Chloroflexota bacterium]
MSATSDRAGFGALWLVACLLVLGGCGGSDDGGDERALRTATSAPPSTQTAPPARPLPAEWYEDPDGDLVPTAVEREIDTDPDVDECAQKAGCGEVSPVNALERSNTLLILDSSGSMAGSAGGGKTKLEAAKRALRRYVAGTPDSLALGFMVYGHKGSNDPAGKAQSCRGVELLEPIGKGASRRFDRSLKRFKPTGYTPLGAALREARDAFEGKEDGINRIILVTDGIETCGGNPVAEARKLKQAGIEVTTDVVGFDVAKPAEAKRLRAIAEASGGEYTDARTAGDLDDYFEQARERVNDLTRQYLCVTEKAAQVSLCQTETGGRGSLYMTEAAGVASREGRDAEADEIERLEEKLDAARERREDASDRQREVVERRLRREINQAERRAERLER